MKRILTLAALCLSLSTAALAQTVTPAPSLLNFQGRLATPSDNAITTTKIADGSITQAKLAPGAGAKPARQLTRKKRLPYSRLVSTLKISCKRTNSVTNRGRRIVTDVV